MKLYSGTKLLRVGKGFTHKASRLIAMNHEVKTRDELWSYLCEAFPNQKLNRRAFVVQDYPFSERQLQEVV